MQVTTTKLDMNLNLTHCDMDECMYTHRHHLQYSFMYAVRYPRVLQHPFKHTDELSVIYVSLTCETKIPAHLSHQA